MSSQYNLPELLAKRYELMEELGRGRCGIVFLAYDGLQKRNVAIKLLSEISVSPLDVKRFQREASFISKLHHPNIVSFYSFGQWKNIYYIVMEYVKGHFLRDYIKISPHPLLCLIESALQICSALEHAHSKGIIHRDIKPDNILVSSEGVVKILDFSIARNLATESTRLTGPDSFIGTMAYMSPEQFLGETLTPLADLYSLGVTLYELATDKLPFTAQNIITLIMQHINISPEPPGAINPAIPESFQKIILKLVEKDPAKRYLSLSSLREDLKKSIFDIKEKCLQEVYKEKEIKNVCRQSSKEDAILSLYTSGNIYLEDGNIEEALKIYKQLLSISEETGCGNGEIYAYTGLGRIHVMNNEFEPAMRCFLKGIETENIFIRTENMCYLTETIIKLNKIDNLKEYIDELKLVLTGICNKFLMGKIYMVFGKYELINLERKKAEDYLKKSKNLLEDTKNYWETGEIFHELGKFYMEDFFISREIKIRIKSIKFLEKAKFLYTCMNMKNKVEEINEELKTFGIISSE
ncbi:MAG TPA: serine/threonine-protein kinase [Candidatus Eremiobacteraeota bacterium]|nr:MAG: Serine/threonine-protein kinase PrkC [bacterium ADurb.Bin363]HPZ10127.1 serine/threonine-protein kinase [Candidatus Eremiobacteraeota bacterium]